ncbi:sensor histidine kinase [Hominifimenecus sp. rT4P-3]|uniref:sensor histidine kinase n=1 Tax=Hominifimenecus sp. rT4P-3 TaxID=3242979 RepID=UPI003DA3E9C1
MKIGKLPRRGYWLIHLICVALLAGGVFGIYSLSRNSYFSYIINQEGYEKTDEFEYQFYQDVDRALRYSELKQKLETNHELNLKKIVAVYPSGEGGQVMLSIQDALDFGKSIGLNFDAENRLVVGSEKVSIQDIYNFSEELGVEETTSVDDEGSVVTSEEQTEAETKVEDNKLWQEILSNETSAGEKALLLEIIYQLAEYYNLQHKLGISGEPRNFLYRFVYTNKEGEPVVSTNMSADIAASDLMQYNRFFSVASESGQMSFKLSQNMATNIFSTAANYGLMQGGTFEIVAAVDTEFSAMDQYREGLKDYRQVQILLVLLAFASLLELIVWGLSLVGLFQTLPREKKPFDAWYVEVVLCVFLVPIAAAVWAGVSIYNGFLMSYPVDVIGGIFIFILAYIPILNILFSFFRRISIGGLQKASLLSQMSHGLGMLFQGISKEGSYAGRTAIGLFGYIILNALFLIGAIIYIEHRWFHLFQGRWSDLQMRLTGIVCMGGLLLLNLLFLIQVIRKTCHREKIAEVVKKISEGKLEAKIDTTGMNGNERALSDLVNEIGDGLSKALVERTKSERMRTDLIANVSHDLRTPLTSIINYVDLLKREQLPGERVQGYVSVLEQKAQRLRNLTEDLVEASKASSGNVSVSWETINFAQLINQMNGEFQEKFEASGLREVTTMEHVPVMIQADGRLLFRVLENLYNNVCKYGMNGTRVYIDLKETSHKAIFTMKNISADPLNIAPEELTERFIRGDVSRSTEGSGLGLSIAKSITELLKGSFEIYLEGDLFRVRLVFSLAEEE